MAYVYKFMHRIFVYEHSLDCLTLSFVNSDYMCNSGSENSGRRRSRKGSEGLLYPQLSGQLKFGHTAHNDCKTTSHSQPGLARGPETRWRAVREVGQA